jgi:hypothetical protein
MKTLVLRLAGVAIFCVLAVPAAAQSYEDTIEAWEATTVQMDVGKMTIVRIGVMEWSTEAERTDMLNALQTGGSEAVVQYLGQQDEKGFVKFQNTAAYQMHYAFQVEHEGKRYVVMATDRPVHNIMQRQAADTLENNISLLSLVLDPETGKGEGTMIAGADIKLDEKTKQLKIEHVGTQPVRFTSVKAMKQKKKKKDKN